MYVPRRVRTNIAIKALCSGNFSAMCGERVLVSVSVSVWVSLAVVRLLPRVTLVANTESNEEQRMTTLSSGSPPAHTPEAAVGDTTQPNTTTITGSSSRSRSRAAAGAVDRWLRQ